MSRAPISPRTRTGTPTRPSCTRRGSRTSGSPWCRGASSTAMAPGRRSTPSGRPQSHGPRPVACEGGSRPGRPGEGDPGAEGLLVIIGPCTVFTGGAEPAVIEEAAVRVVGGHIAQLGPAGNLASGHPDETLWPARGRVLMPGFVNTHAHLARHLARGLGLRSAADWRRYDDALSPNDVHWAVMAALVEGVRHGVTSVCDFHRSGACLERALPEVGAAA